MAPQQHLSRPSKATVNKELFDHNIFTDDLTKESNRIKVFKRAIKRANKIFKDRYMSGEAAYVLVHQRAWLIDQILHHASNLFVDSDSLALIAVGGYGRGELHPHSDIDLMLLLPNKGQQPGEKIGALIAFLWDIGLEAHHSVRTINECKAEAAQDLTIVTSLMEAKLLNANQELFDKMQAFINTKKLWSSRKFFEHKLAEQAERYQKQADTSYNVEPNIKECPGGLRDIQMLAWVLKRHVGIRQYKEQIQAHLSREEYQTLQNAREFLWRIRFGLHLLAKQREDRLLFDYQKQIAKQFGFSGKQNTGVEKFMRLYYRTVYEARILNDILLQHFQEVILTKPNRSRLISINNRFQIRNHFIEAKHEKVFKDDPHALLEIFLLLQQNRNIKGIRADTIRLIKKYAAKINDTFRLEQRACNYFMEILRQPRLVGHELRRMHRYGVLGNYVTAFGKIQGLMQFDLFHSYTVDEHILFVVRNLRRFSLPEYQAQFPLCHEVIQHIPKLEILYIAGIFHDIAKGRKGDHSTLGGKDAALFCTHHGLSEDDTKLIVWLVENHLLMSMTSQKQDISDPDVIKAFTLKVADKNYLRHLYLLTVADICGTNPKLWNSWKASLLADLYHRSLQMMHKELDQPLHKRKRLQEIKQATLLRLAHTKLADLEIKKIWRTFGEYYFLRHEPDEIAWHTKAIINTNAKDLPLVVTEPNSKKGYSRIFIYTRDIDNIFARTVKTIEQLSLNVLDARIITSKNGYTLDTYVVLEENGKPIMGKTRCKEITNKLRKILSDQETLFNGTTKRQGNRQLKHFNIETYVHFTSDTKNARTILEVVTKDAPGLLSKIGNAIALCGAKLQGAKISTYGERVEDIFYFADEPNEETPHRSAILRECLEKSIIRVLS